MGIKAYVSTIGGSRVTINSKKNQIVRATGPQISSVAINDHRKNLVRYIAGVGIGGADGVNRISELLDVDMSGAETNETLVFDQSNGVFTVKELPKISGGDF